MAHTCPGHQTSDTQTCRNWGWKLKCFLGTRGNLPWDKTQERQGQEWVPSLGKRKCASVFMQKQRSSTLSVVFASGVWLHLNKASESRIFRSHPLKLKSRKHINWFTLGNHFLHCLISLLHVLYNWPFLTFSFYLKKKITVKLYRKTDILKHF